MVILLILAIVCGLLAWLKTFDPAGFSLSVIVYLVVAVVCLVIYIAGIIEKKREERL